jgi:hypothetical protein
MPDIYQIVLVVVLGLVVFLPFGIGRSLARMMWSLVFYILGSPYWLWRGLHQWFTAHCRRRNYEILGRYVALLGNNPEILRYFRQLIESGISQKELEKLLADNLANLRQFEVTQQQNDVQQKSKQEETFKTLVAEQEEMLARSRASMEQIKFREQLLEQLYHKIRRKYRL